MYIDEVAVSLLYNQVRIPSIVQPRATFLDSTSFQPSVQAWSILVAWLILQCYDLTVALYNLSTMLG